MQRLFIDLHPIKPVKGASQAIKPLTLEKIQGQFIIVLGRRVMPSETIPQGCEGIVVSVYDTAFELIELLNKLMRGERGAAELIPHEHFLVATPFDQTRAKIFLQYNVAVVPEHNQTPSFVIPFEELAREILLFCINVYESILEMYPQLQTDLETLGTAIEETKLAVEQHIGNKNFLSLPAEDETKVS
ncbi:MAG: hypothetical protein RBG13Loki_4051 [Promethearchaeota archaeon CR_4]|nr:MAG: hypothetical protein RBG13Loki_4051 [Candidatus Lokiarchaeota archaeon CR_4]